MRTLLKFSIDVAIANKAIAQGTFPKVMEQVMALTKPEAAYFLTLDGVRTGLIFFDMKDSSEIPVIAEPLFQNLNAKVEFLPAMNADDLKTGLSKALANIVP